MARRLPTRAGSPRGAAPVTRPALPLFELAPRELAARDPSPTLALDFGMSLETYNKLVTRRELETEDTVAGDDALAGTLAAAPTTLRASASDAPLARGEVIGRYVVLDLVGAGGMGVVYAGYDPELDRKVALKLLRAPPPSAAASPSASGSRRRLVREAQALAKLAHPNVVAIHDVGEHDGSVWLAMEFVAGVTLAAWLRARPRSWPEVLEVLIPAGRGLAAAHEAQLLHRDFKPENIMVGDDGRVRVMDLGLARVTGDEPRAPPPAQDVALDGVAEALLPTLLTHGGALIGTPAYMAPEQLQGREVDVRADVFAFCVTLWEALHGVRPFAGETLAALTARVLAGEVSPPPSGRAAPAWLRRVCLRGLALEPGRRWSSMAAALAALDRGRRRARATRWIASIAALALAGAGLALHERAQAQAL
ncbi:MAG: serine/threonine protein kinase, partial [Myxococcales bacterium]|nr:serine/threonine protein kinase [Myxococcales bacterium]